MLSLVSVNITCYNESLYVVQSNPRNLCMLAISLDTAQHGVKPNIFCVRLLYTLSRIPNRCRYLNVFIR